MMGALAGDVAAERECASAKPFCVECPQMSLGVPCQPCRFSQTKASGVSGETTPLSNHTYTK